MNSSIWIARMYRMVESKMGHVQAKKSVSVMMSLIINDLLEEEKEITAENLNIRIESYVKDFYEIDETKKSA